jgi:probable F420-dependent oxidoreductase
VKSDTALIGGVDRRDVATQAERRGFHGLWMGEVDHDPFLQLGLAATAMTNIALGTSIAVAFARSPMTTALLSDDLQGLSGGRFLLGLGTQVKAHITRRYSMEWSQPVERMGEYVAALKAIWACWDDDAALSFQGDFYTHTLMPPMFRPARHGHPRPRVLLAGVGSAMTALAGQIADGFLCHAFTTDTYLREVTVPALISGSCGSRADFEIVGSPFIVVGRTEEDLKSAEAVVRKQIAFYGSTPAYSSVLARHGWADIGAELHALSTRNRWAEMADVVTDEMMRAFTISGSPADAGRQLVTRYDGIFTRVVLHTAYPLGPDILPELLDAAGNSPSAT